MKKIELILFVAFLFLITACEKDISSPVETSFDNAFLPLEPGRWISYQIQNITFDIVIGINDTTNYQIKEQIDSLIEEHKDYKNYSVKRFFRYSNNEEWTLFKVWQIRQYANRIHKIEENIDYIRLVTPVVLNKKWNGNSYNELDEQEYNIERIEPSSLANSSIEIAYVIQNDESSLVEKQYSEEQYAKGIGLIYKTEIDVELNTDPSLEWQQKITKGSVFSQQYIEHHE